MIKSILIAVAFVLLVLALLCTAIFAQSTTYTQTTHACTMTGCSDAQFNPAATLSYSAEFVHCGDKGVDMIVNWNGTEYTDGKADMNWLGYTYLGHNYYPWGVYELRGIFNNGTSTVVEHVASYRGCSGRFNIDGFVTVQ